MKIRNTFLCKTAALTMAVLLGLAGTVFAADAVQEAPAEEETQAAEVEVKTYGTESEDAVKFEFVNMTGKDITFLSVSVDDGGDQTEGIKMLQEILIEEGFLDDAADGAYGPKTKAAVKAYREAHDLSAEEVVDDEMLVMMFPDYDDGNVLDEGEVIKPEETVVIYYKEEAEEETSEEAAAAEANPYDQYVTYANFIAEFNLADDETDYTLHTLATEGETMYICTDGPLAYIQYQAKNSEYYISTYDTESTIMYPPQPVYYETPAYYDTSSYYYETPVYENPNQGNDGCIDTGEALYW